MDDPCLLVSMTNLDCAHQAQRGIRESETSDLACPRTLQSPKTDKNIQLVGLCQADLELAGSLRLAAENPESGRVACTDGARKLIVVFDQSGQVELAANPAQAPELAPYRYVNPNDRRLLELDFRRRHDDWWAWADEWKPQLRWAYSNTQTGVLDLETGEIRSIGQD